MASEKGVSALKKNLSTPKTNKMFGLEKYKDVLGKPGVGVHNHGVFGFAVLDLLATLVVAFLIAKYARINFYVCSIVLLLCGIVLHKLFGVDTKVNSILFKK